MIDENSCMEHLRVWNSKQDQLHSSQRRRSFSCNVTIGMSLGYRPLQSYVRMDDTFNALSYT